MESFATNLTVVLELTQEIWTTAALNPERSQTFCRSERVLCAVLPLLGVDVR